MDEKIKEKGFSMYNNDDIDIYGQNHSGVEFSKIKVGVKSLQDAIIKLGDYKEINQKFSDKKFVLDALSRQDLTKLRKISNFYFKVSGIQARLCKYMAYLYRYDWMVTPYFFDESEKTKKKITDQFNKILYFLDSFGVKKFLGAAALRVIRDGCYYGYLIPQGDRFVVQDLPVDYCRSKYFVGGRPAVEMNMKFFDDTYSNIEQRLRILKAFPKDIQKGYSLQKQGKLVAVDPNEEQGWYLLDTTQAFKFNVNGEDVPIFSSVIPAIIDLDMAQELDRKKTAQQLLKIIIQKLPTDKNGDLIFDVEEAKQLHNNAVQMLGKAIGIDVLTTFAEVQVEDMADNSTTTSTDELEKVERTVYNESGTAQNLFNTDGNIALEKSILNDEASIYNLILQFEEFLNYLIDFKYTKNTKKYQFRVQILTTTIYNYKEMAKLYKEQMQVGYSKFLAQIASGQSQSSILANAYFENNILDLVNVFIPPLMSSTMNAEALSDSTTETVGRKELPDEEKSEKTIANRESMS